MEVASLVTYTQPSYIKFVDWVSSPKVTQYRKPPLLVNLLTNSRGIPAWDGDPTRVIVPLEVPFVALSWVPCQLLSAWMLLTLTAFEGTTEVSVEGSPGAFETVMATSDTQTAPPVPHDLTCSVWVPSFAVTLVSIDVLPLK